MDSKIKNIFHLYDDNKMMTENKMNKINDMNIVDDASIEKKRNK